MTNGTTPAESAREAHPARGLLRAVASLGSSKLLFVAAAGLSFALSVVLWFGGDRERGLFVGLWVPSILAAGGLLHAGEGPRRE